MTKIIYIIVLSFFVNHGYSQTGLQLESFTKKEYRSFQLSSASKIDFTQKNLQKGITPIDLKQFILNDEMVITGNSIFSSQYSMQVELAFFCRIESKIEQSSKVPVKFRLGEVQQVDQKEGKWKQFNLEN